MCAECHSTDLKKGYDYRSDAYTTTWSEISVGCEACHGPGSAHVKWSRLPEMGRPAVDNYALTVRTRDLTSQQQIELCAPCHSRRMSLDDNIHHHADFLDYGIPQLLTEGLYFADGQIEDEVYVYGSFLQSKMYKAGVVCTPGAGFGPCERDRAPDVLVADSIIIAEHERGRCQEQDRCGGDDDGEVKVSSTAKSSTKTGKKA